jgi:hypothetical protein
VVQERDAVRGEDARDRALGEVDDDDLAAQLLEEVRPAAVARRDLEDPLGGDVALQPREQRRPSLVRHTAPGV